MQYVAGVCKWRCYGRYDFRACTKWELMNSYWAAHCSIKQVLASAKAIRGYIVGFACRAPPPVTHVLQPNWKHPCEAPSLLMPLDPSWNNIASRRDDLGLRGISQGCALGLALYPYSCLFNLILFVGRNTALYIERVPVMSKKYLCNYSYYIPGRLFISTQQLIGIHGGGTWIVKDNLFTSLVMYFYFISTNLSLYYFWFWLNGSY